MRINLQEPKPYDGRQLTYPVMMLPARIGTPAQAIVKTDIDLDDFIMGLTGTPGRAPEVSNYAVAAVAEHLMAMANNMERSVDAWMQTSKEDRTVWAEGAIFDGVLLSAGKPVNEDDLMDEWPVDRLQFVLYSVAPLSTGLLTEHDDYHLQLRRFVLQRALAIQHAGIEAGQELFNHPVVISPYSIIHDDAQLGDELQVVMKAKNLNGVYVRHQEATWGHKKKTDWWHVLDDSQLL
ncbi:hypothetical protein MA11_gp34 [Pectobacterium phage MA11]|uniref:hypothetical protein n=1 Tax=Pectobacterium phage MA11 TaxID=2662283 RepID=UPI0012A9FB49|nr:hypothetical protein JT356_gp34 [Pectobacterium phage MA11]QGF21059.1 hypothetical protein MA11_gp34 [Pectobacterium phage MA11]